MVFIGGGNTFYLSYWIQKSGLSQMLPELLKTKVYVGISAGSMVAGKSLVIAPQPLDNSKMFHDKDYYDTPPPAKESAYTLNLADLIFRPHLNSPLFKKVRVAALQQKAKHIDAKIYALDDNLKPVPLRLPHRLQRRARIRRHVLYDRILRLAGVKNFYNPLVGA